VAEGLRGAALSGRSAGLRMGVRQSSLYGNYWYEYNGNGYFAGTPPAGAYQQITTQERASAQSARFSTWKEIEDSATAIRQKMTQKYMIEF
jgi:hypothetical protein